MDSAAKIVTSLCCLFAVVAGRELRCLPGTSCVAAANGSIITVGPEHDGPYQIEFPQLGDSDMILLEFLNSSALALPSSTYDGSTGDCLREYISFLGSPTPIEPFRLCGHLTGQHVYLSYGLFPTIYMTIIKEYNSNVVMRLTYFSRKYRPVPSGCLQYYTGNNAEIRSFGYPDRQLNNLRYTICFDESRANALTVTDCPGGSGVAGTFSITGIRNEIILDPEYMGPYVPLLECYGDWIQLFGQNKYCNQTLPREGLSTTTKPFQIAVNFDSKETRAFLQPMLPGGCVSSSPCFTCTDGSPMYPNQCNCIENTAPDGNAPPGLGLQCAFEATLNRIDRYNRGFCLRATLTY